MQFIKFAVLTALPLTFGACTLTIGDGDGSDSAPASDSASAPATEPASTSTTGGTTSTPTEAAATTSSTSNDSTTSTPTEAADSTSTSAADTTTSGSETGPVGGACGWVEADHVYSCGGVGEDPDGILPIDCVEPPVEGAPCDGGQGPIADPGCCSDGVNAYCYLNKLVVVVCR